MNTVLPLSKRLIGYANESSVQPGDKVSFYVSGTDATEYSIQIARLLGGGYDPSAPELRYELQDDLGGYPLNQQLVTPGSYGTARLSAASLAGLATSGSLSLTLRPSRVGHAQTALCVGDGAIVVGLDSGGRVVATTPGSEPGMTVAEPVSKSGWTDVHVSWAEGRGTVAIRQRGGAWETATGEFVVPAEQLASGIITVGAFRAGNKRKQHFSGRIEAPTIYATPSKPSVTAADPLIGWDFSKDIPAWSVPSVGYDAPLILKNLPKKAVRGSRWQSSTNWQDAPDEYSAIHFYPDSLEDCEWETQATWTVPADAQSGFYAARVTSSADADWIPFFVRPGLQTLPDAVLVVASTATYAAYANSRFWWEDPIQEIAQDRLVELGAEEQYLVTHPELGLSCYDMHLDDTPVVFSSRLRPNLFMRPGHSRSESYASDLYLIAWLEHLGVPYEVITDEDIHFRGRDHLDRYRVAISGTHPEYISNPMFDSMKEWVEAGGRYMYLGGNGFTSNVTWGAERPWVMEDRTTGRLRGDAETQRTEAYNQTDGGLGLWMEESGRATRTLFGVDSVTMGFDRSYPINRTETSRQPEFDFAFQDIPGQLFGGRSLSGGGVIGQEWDNARNVDNASGHYILASSLDHSLIPSILGAETPHHGDVVLYFHQKGAVFSASSMAWVGALHINDYDNDANTFTRNILNRFQDPTHLEQPTSHDVIQ